MNAKYGNVIDLTGTMCIHSTIQPNGIGRFTPLVSISFIGYKRIHIGKRNRLIHSSMEIVSYRRPFVRCIGKSIIIINSGRIIFIESPEKSVNRILTVLKTETDDPERSKVLAELSR